MAPQETKFSCPLCRELGQEAKMHEETRRLYQEELKGTTYFLLTPREQRFLVCPENEQHLIEPEQLKAYQNEKMSLTHLISIFWENRRRVLTPHLWRLFASPRERYFQVTRPKGRN